MLSVIILFCDKDVKYIPSLLKNIKENLSIDYEIVLIDNRETNKDKLSIDPDIRYFAFGYNARQVQGRKKGVELAKGDYIWFVDADDEILEVDSSFEKLMQKDYDIIVFDKSKYTHVKNNLMEQSILASMGVQLWNKWVKTSVLRKVEEYIPTDISGTASEDAMLVIGSLKFGKSIFFYQQRIYKYMIGRSTCGCPSMDEERFKRIIHGYKQVTECIDKMLSAEDKIKLQWTDHVRGDIKFFLDRIKLCKVKDIPECIKVLTDTFNYEDLIIYWTASYNCDDWEKEKFLAARKTLLEIYPDKEMFINASNVIQYYTLDKDGNEYCYKSEVENKVPDFLKEWNHSLSIVCVVYEGNVKYLKKFLNYTKRIEVPFEVVVVDNRDDKSKPLNVKDVILVETEKNLGILDGRRAGFEASHNEYVWFVDIDDEILNVRNMDYGDNDIICFSFYDINYNPIRPCSQVITGSKVCSRSTLNDINIMLWHKWFKRDVLEKAYYKIPHFFCIYSEDVLVSIAALEFADSVRCLDTLPMYKYNSSQDSITQKKINTKEGVDKLFVGFEEVVKILPQLKLRVFHNSNESVKYYIDIANRSDDSVKQYFADVLIRNFGRKSILENLDLEHKKFLEYVKIN